MVAEICRTAVQIGGATGGGIVLQDLPVSAPRRDLFFYGSASWRALISPLTLRPAAAQHHLGQDRV